MKKQSAPLLRDALLFLSGLFLQLFVDQPLQALGLFRCIGSGIDLHRLEVIAQDVLLARDVPILIVPQPSSGLVVVGCLGRGIVPVDVFHHISLLHMKRLVGDGVHGLLGSPAFQHRPGEHDLPGSSAVVAQPVLVERLDRDLCPVRHPQHGKLIGGQLLCQFGLAVQRRRFPGIRRVAICRMDVDNLGQAFIAGFEQPDQTDPVQRMKYVNLFRAAAEQTAALEDEAKKLPGKNGAALFDAVPDHTYSWDVLQDKVLGEKIACLEQFFAQFQKKDDDHRGNSMLYNLTALLRNTREDQVNFARCVYLLARRSCVNGETLPDFSADGEVILRMFGGSEPVRFARLQFADAFLLNYDQLKGVGVTEVKSENVISRLTSKATPRQIERVVAGSRFGVNIVYNLSDPKEMEEDLSLLSKAMKLLQLDYLGGHGSRGNGRVSFQNFQVIPYPETLNVDPDGIRQPFKTEVEEYELFSAKAGV